MITIEQTSFRHQGGTKFYEITLLSNTANGRFLVVYRWGKIAFRTLAGGQIKIETFGNKRLAGQAVLAKTEAKEKGGYTPCSEVRKFDDCEPHELGKNLDLFLTQDDATLVATSLGISVARSEEDDEIIDETLGEEEILKPVREPVVRGDEWGSW